jgi:hypothetical protein
MINSIDESVTAARVRRAARGADLARRGDGRSPCVAQPITLGASSTTFVIPDLSLPAEFAIIRPATAATC